ncbi:hypothetical protein [Desulfomonile tiedjei]|uniref:Uncharacterized protein n=1 Tax=Desulfomonile tiedjei (strain ATCC 49306 / DSM 6799 / DCB-1) TaxID=706587 RepID=I4C988_DESTA|nr:hypothetical protein [Desulfomonile tiedjei]AFM26129.1 hypothetical protein Desti_3478 [Desulfomonile tiedjei DSM 6799]
MDKDRLAKLEVILTSDEKWKRYVQEHESTSRAYEELVNYDSLYMNCKRGAWPRNWTIKLTKVEGDTLRLEIDSLCDGMDLHHTFDCDDLAEVGEILRDYDPIDDIWLPDIPQKERTWERRKEVIRQKFRSFVRDYLKSSRRSMLLPSITEDEM